MHLKSDLILKKLNVNGLYVIILKLKVTVIVNNHYNAFYDQLDKNTVSDIVPSERGYTEALKL